MSFRKSHRKNKKLEREANWFAVAFLMPKDRFEAELQKDPNDSHLAAVFDVPIEVIKYRKQNYKEF